MQLVKVVITIAFVIVGCPEGLLKVKVWRCTRNVNISHTGYLDCYTEVVVSTILCVSLFRKLKSV